MASKPRKRTRSLPLNTPTIDRLLGSLVVDSSKICNTLNWQPPYTIDEGLDQTIARTITPHYPWGNLK